jgi:hypothetical protein
MRIFIEKGLGGHNYSGSAKAALKSGVLDKSLLQRIKLAGFRISQTLDGRDAFAIAFNGENFAGIDCLAIHNDGTSAAGALTAGGLGTRQSQSFS